MKRVLDRLERWIRPYAIPNLTIGLVACQVMTYIVINFIRADDPGIIENLILVPAWVMDGKWWLIFTFLAMPPNMHLFFAFFYFYLFYMMGSALEANWGAARYNLFILIGYLATVAAAMGAPFIWPEAASFPATNLFLGTVFLAFAVLNPDFQLMIMLILPVKIKWLALLQWIMYGVAFVGGTALTRVLIATSVLNFFLFFGGDIWNRLRSGQRRMRHQARQVAAAKRPFHTCAICGITEKSDPQAEFRYCSKCKPSQCYCADHLKNHQHVAPRESSV